MNGTIIQQGRFTATGATTILNIRSDVDWIRVYNSTVSYAAGADTGAEFYWQRGMTQGRGTIYTKTTTTNALQVGQIAVQGGFTLIDQSIQTLGPVVALSAISNAATPVVSTASTAGLSNGDVVRLYNVTGGQQLGGIDFTIGSIVANTSFTLAFMAQIAAATTGSYRKVNFNPLFYPRRRFISKIASVGTTTVITMTVTHQFTVGQEVRFIIPTVDATHYGMTELNGVQASIIAVDLVNNTITIDIDSSGFTAFAFPLTSSPGFTPAQVVPVGEDTATALNFNVDILGDATENQGIIGIQMAAGTLSPAGVASDVIFWVAGKSFSVDNQ
jgi:hypothetical protein